MQSIICLMLDLLDKRMRTESIWDFVLFLNKKISAELFSSLIFIMARIFLKKC